MREALNRASIEVQSGDFSSWWENKEKADINARAENETHKPTMLFVEHDVKFKEKIATKAIEL